MQKPPQFPKEALLPTVLPVFLLAVGLSTVPMEAANRLQLQWVSGDAVFGDITGQPLARGEAGVNGDGDMVQLGYFSQASSNDLFQGDWVPLTAGTTFGDSSTLAGADVGIFHFSTLFEVGTDVVRVFPDSPGEFAATSAIAIEQGDPVFGKLLAIRFYDGPSISAGVRYNTVAHPEWEWGSPMAIPFPINIQLSSADAELVYQDADHPAVASIVVNPDTDNPSIHMVSGTVVGSGSIEGLGKYETGVDAVLKAVPKEGNDFVGWSGDLSGLLGEQSVSVTGDLSVTATFQARNYVVAATVSPSSSGTVAGTGSHAHGTFVELKATPSLGFRFSHWTGISENTTNNPLMLEISSALSLQAVFEMALYSVTTVQTPDEGGLVSGGGIFSYGQKVDISAVAAEGYFFAGWQGEGIDNLVATSTQHTVSGDTVITGIFEKPAEDNYLVVLAAQPTEGGTVSGAGEHANGQSVTITAEPAEGYFFEKWLDADGTESYVQSFTVTLIENLSHVAVFGQHSYKVQVMGDSSSESEPPTGTGSFILGTTATLTATPAEGYSFSVWTIGGNVDYDVQVGTRMDGLGSADGPGPAYLLDTHERPTLRFHRDVTYRFFLDGISTASHPFYFSTSADQGAPDAYIGEFTTGVTNSRGISGSVEIAVGASTPDTLYYYSGLEWGVGGQIQVLDSSGILSAASANPATLTVLGDVSVQATYFEGESEHVLSLSAEPVAGGSVSGGGTYAHGTNVQIQAMPSLGYYFSSWTGGASQDPYPLASIISISLDADAGLTANFLPNEVTATSWVGWVYSPWLEFFRRDSNGWVFSVTHGWIYPSGTSDDSVYFSSPAGNWYWTSATNYPLIYSYAGGTWLYYSADESTASTTYFYDYFVDDWMAYEPASLTPR